MLRLDSMTVKRSMLHLLSVEASAMRNGTGPRRIARLQCLLLGFALCLLSGTCSVTGSQSLPPRPEIVLQTGHPFVFGQMVVSPDGRLIASAGGVESRDGTVKLWDVQNRRQVRTLTGHSGS